MIDVLSTEQVREIIELRKQEFKLDDYFLVLTPLNHIFFFWSNGGINIRTTICNSISRQLEIAKLYGIESDAHFSMNIANLEVRKHLYELFINDPECMFVKNSNELEQEFQIEVW